MPRSATYSSRGRTAQWVRATRHPSYYDFNLVRVEEDPQMTGQALMAFADEALAGLAHRRLDFDVADTADPLRAFSRPRA